jgi:hypothetical protein
VEGVDEDGRNLFSDSEIFGEKQVKFIRPPTFEWKNFVRDETFNFEIFLENLIVRIFWIKSAKNKQRKPILKVQKNSSWKKAINNLCYPLSSVCLLSAFFWSMPSRNSNELPKMKLN